MKSLIAALALCGLFTSENAIADEIRNSSIVQLPLTWCDGQFVHLVKALQFSVETKLGEASNTIIVKKWQEISSKRCSVATPAWLPKALESQVEAKKHPSRDGLCVCGFNTHYECDAGGYNHAISDCYDSDTGGYCGYDDQVIGTCSPSSKSTPKKQ